MCCDRHLGRVVLLAALVGCAGPDASGPGSSRSARPADSDQRPTSTTPGGQSQHADRDSGETEPPARFTPFEGITVDPSVPAIEVQAWACLDAGWLEQVACGLRSREHESLVVVGAQPSNIHAALLLAGFEPGVPGGWELVNDELVVTSPRGSPLDILVRYEDSSGAQVERPVRDWIRDHQGLHEFPLDPWVFAGSLIETNQEWMGPGEHYVADFSGSIIGLVTFGDEVVGFSRVLSDKQVVQPPEWEVWTERMPPIGTPVTVILRGPTTTDAAVPITSAVPASGDDPP